MDKTTGTLSKLTYANSAVRTLQSCVSIPSCFSIEALEVTTRVAPPGKGLALLHQAVHPVPTRANSHRERTNACPYSSSTTRSSGHHCHQARCAYAGRTLPLLVATLVALEVLLTTPTKQHPPQEKSQLRQQLWLYSAIVPVSLRIAFRHTLNLNSTTSRTNVTVLEISCFRYVLSIDLNIYSRAGDNSARLTVSLPVDSTSLSRRSPQALRNRLPQPNANCGKAPMRRPMLTTSTPVELISGSEVHRYRLDTAMSQHPYENLLRTIVLRAYSFTRSTFPTRNTYDSTPMMVTAAI